MNGQSADLTAGLDGHDGIMTLRDSETHRDWNGIRYKTGISGRNVGDVRHDFGEDLQHSIENSAGDFIFIEPGVPHEVRNLSDTDPVVAVVARSDASEWENIVDYPSKRRPGV